MGFQPATQNHMISWLLSNEFMGMFPTLQEAKKWGLAPQDSFPLRPVLWQDYIGTILGTISSITQIVP